MLLLEGHDSKDNNFFVVGKIMYNVADLNVGFNVFTIMFFFPPFFFFPSNLNLKMMMISV